MSSFQQIENEIRVQIQELTNNAIKTLSEIWMETFDLVLCEANIKKLPEHVSMFYNEIILETQTRRETTVKAIENIKEEGEMLQHLLNVEVDLYLPENIPFYTAQMYLDEKLRDLRKRLAKRKDEIYKLLLEQDTLCEELQEMPKTLLYDPLPTEEELQNFRSHLDALKAEKNHRIYKIKTCRRDIKYFMKELELPIQTNEEQFLLNDSNIPLTRTTIERLINLHCQYVRQMEEMRESIDNMKNKLNILWEFLDISQSVRNKFSKYTNYSQTTFDRYYHELNRCEDIKRENIKKFVDKIRDDILIWWDKTLKSDSERARFKNFTNDCYTEDLMALHEIELEELKEFYTKNEKIFEFIAERKILWDRMEALEQKASEPGRYNNRGGKLLKEEKERKEISSKLPKIEQELIEFVEKYEHRYNRKFTIFGDDILEIIHMEWELKHMKKESTRKNYSPLSRGNIPMSFNNVSSIKRFQSPMSKGNTPMSIRNVSSMKKLPSSTNISSKRKLALISDELSSKRSPLTQLNSPNIRLRPTSSAIKTPFKSPMKRIRVLASTINRRLSGRLSGSAKKRRSKTTPKICVNEETITSDTCYDTFEDHIEKDPSCRSSVICENNEKKMIHHRRKNVTSTTSRLIPTRSKNNVFEQTAVMKNTPSRAPLGQTFSPGRSTTSRKLTTKNLPIII